MNAYLQVLISIVILLVVLFPFVRIQVAFVICTRAGNILSEYLRGEIHAGRILDIREIRQMFDRLEETSYDSLVWNPFIWTTRQAFPWLYDIATPRQSGGYQPIGHLDTPPPQSGSGVQRPPREVS